MQLTMFSDLGLRIIMVVASAEPGRKFTAGAVADYINASRAHVSKVVTRLAELDILQAQKGRGGGIYFREEARQTSVGALLRKLEQGEVVDCEGTQCPMIPGCRLRGALAEAKEAFFKTLDAVTIDQIAAPGSHSTGIGDGRSVPTTGRSLPLSSV